VILVIAEQRDGKLNRATLETIAAAQQLSGDAAIKAVVLGQSVAAVAQDLVTAVGEVLLVENASLGTYTPDAFTAAVQQVVASVKPAYVLLPHTYQTRDFAPKLAARLDRAIVTDVTGVKRVGSEVAFVRPMFQGKLTADVVPEGPGPHFVTFQIGAFRADQAARGNQPAPVRALTVAVDGQAIRQKPEAPFQEARQAVDPVERKDLYAQMQKLVVEDAPDIFGVLDKRRLAFRDTVKGFEFTPVAGNSLEFLPLSLA